MESHALKLIVIHGGGGSYSDALESLDTLTAVPVRWADGAFYVKKPHGLMLSRLLFVNDPTPLLQTLQKLAVSRLLASCFEDASFSIDNAFRLNEQRLLNSYRHLGLPIGPGDRYRRSQQLLAEAKQELAALGPALERLRQELVGEDGRRLKEKAARNNEADESDRATILAGLETLRGMQETGGDMDTVASAVLYAHWLAAEAAKAGREFVYGKDYRFVFVNYHDGIEHLADLGPAELYMADMPIGALPDFDTQVRHLAEADVVLKRFEDHHPYSTEQIEMLNRLKDEDLLEFLAMSGAQDDAELAEDEEFCAADMVYQNVIAGQDWDTPAMAALQRTAHAEDWVTDRTDFSKTMTELIKGGVCKIEMAQEILACTEEEDLYKLPVDNGWQALVDEWRESFREVEDPLWENVVCLKIPRDGSRMGGAPALAEGSDVPVPVNDRPADDMLRVLIVLAHRPAFGAPRLPVGKVAEYFSTAYPIADYFFYCYGSSLMVARRMNQADLTLNLGALMPELGGPGDGGHAGAAVCRPDANPAYPDDLLRRVGGHNFGRFCQYLAGRLAEATGMPIGAVENLSKPAARKADDMGKASKRLLIMAASAVLLGLAILLFDPRFRQDKIDDSNRDFQPKIAPAQTDPVTERDDQNASERPGDYAY